LIDKGMAKGYIKYRENYKYYRQNQERLFGKLEWPPLYPTEESKDT